MTPRYSHWMVPDLASPDRAAELLSRAADVDKFTLNFTETQKIFPNGAVPFAAALAFVRSTGECQVEVEVVAGGASCSSVSAPLTLQSYDRQAGDKLTNSVWLYKSESEALTLTKRFMSVLLDQVRCEEGVIDSINWCLYEVMDNVFQHSLSDAGFVMMQLHQKQRLCVIAVGDTGVGIQKSLAMAYRAGASTADPAVLRDPGAAIDYALQKGVTSKGGENQGNGLFGLRRAAEMNGGRLGIHSGFGSWRLVDGKVAWTHDRWRKLADMENHQGTLIDWQLDCSREVKIYEALGAKQTSSDLLETIESDDGVHRIPVEEIEAALGSRGLGSELRTRLINYLRAGARFLVLDFRNVGVVSSSFADEVLAKLAVSMGELPFRRQIRLEGVSTTNFTLIESAIQTRLEAASDESGVGIDQ